MTHDEREQLLLAYFLKYRDTLNLAGVAKKAGIKTANTLKLFVLQQRGLSADALAKLWAWSQQLHHDTQVFT